MCKENKKRFVSYELGLLSISAALSTRDKIYPIYKESVKSHQRANVKFEIRRVLNEIEEEYSEEPKVVVVEQDNTYMWMAIIILSLILLYFIYLQSKK